MRKEHKIPNGNKSTQKQAYGFHAYFPKKKKHSMKLSDTEELVRSKSQIPTMHATEFRAFTYWDELV